MKVNTTQQRYLLDTARSGIAEKLGLAFPFSATEDAVLQQHGATFVTLKKKGRLRGCIGTLVAVESIIASVRSNAVNAAFHDHRFSPVSVDEFDELNIGVSILTPATPLVFVDGDDLCRKLRPGVDGVVLRYGGCSATFLPQVWEQLPDAGTFLSHLCLKAGLAQDVWKEQAVKVSIYQVVSFSEGG